MFHQFDWLAVFQTRNEAEAQGIAAVLETHGIVTRLHPEESGLTAGQLGGVQVLVDTRDYEQALTFLRQNMPAREAFPA